MNGKEFCSDYKSYDKGSGCAKPNIPNSGNSTTFGNESSYLQNLKADNKVNETENADNFMFYPNPTSDELSIQYNSLQKQIDATIKIYDLFRRCWCYHQQL